jgi:hypothetical protein
VARIDEPSKRLLPGASSFSHDPRDKNTVESACQKNRRNTVADKKEEDTIEILANTGKTSLVKRTKGGEETIHTIAPVDDGKPINPDSELFQLEARPGEPRKYNVKTFYEGKKGPARTSNKEYRNGWDSICGNKKKAEGLN